MKKNLIISCILALAAVSCTKAPSFSGSSRGGTLDADDEGDSNTLDGSPVKVSSAYTGLQCNTDSPKGFRAWRRLSNTEIKNTVTSVFGVTGIDYASLPDDITRLDIYDSMMVPSNYIDSQRLRAFRIVAKSIAAKADLSKLFPCLKDGADCITATMATLGANAWRRPLTTDESNKLTALYAASVADVGSEGAARLLIQALLMAQPFMYRSELGVKDADGSYTLTDWEMASALSYNILRMPPDATLRGLAASKELNTPDAIKKQVARLFADPQAKEAFKDFGNMWLDARSITSTDRPSVKEWTADVKNAAKAEVGDLFSEVMWKSSGSTLEGLMVAESTPSSGVTSFVYGVPAAAGHIAFKEADRRGILGQASYLGSTAAITYTSPVKRGAFIIERLMCTGFGPAPVSKLPEVQPGQSNRDRYLALEKIPSCATCHVTMNQFGFVFENFDMVGRYREEADGQDISVNSKVTIDGKPLTVHSAKEFSAAIAKSEQGRECFARHVFRYNMGRHEYSPLPVIGAPQDSTVTVTKQTDADNCQIKAISDAMGEADGDLKTPIVELLTSNAFRQRVERKAQK